MTISDLKKMIEVAEQLGQGDAVVCINASRDGVKSFPKATARFVEVGSQQQPCTILVFR